MPIILENVLFENLLIYQIKQYERGVKVHNKRRPIDDVAINDVTFFAETYMADARQM